MEGAWSPDNAYSANTTTSLHSAWYCFDCQCVRLHDNTPTVLCLHLQFDNLVPSCVSEEVRSGLLSFSITGALHVDNQTSHDFKKDKTSILHDAGILRYELFKCSQ